MADDFDRIRARKKSVLHPEMFMNAVAANKGRRRSVLPSEIMGKATKMATVSKENATLNELIAPLLILKPRDADVYSEEEAPVRKYPPVPNTLKEAEMQVEGQLLRYRQSLMEMHPSHGLEEGETLMTYFAASRPSLKNSSFRVVITNKRYIRMGMNDNTILDWRDLRDIISVEADTIPNIFAISEYATIRKSETEKIKAEASSNKSPMSFFSSKSRRPKTLVKGTGLAKIANRNSLTANTAKPVVDPNAIELQGWLQKKQGWNTEGGRRNWKTFYCLLRKGRMYFFKSDSDFEQWDENPGSAPELKEMEIDLREFIFVPESHKDMGLALRKEGVSDDLQISFTNQGAYEEWFQVIADVIDVFHASKVAEQQDDPGTGRSDDGDQVDIERLIESAVANKGLVLKEGFLFCKEIGIRHSWLRRFAVIKDGHLLLYKEDESASSHGPAVMSTSLVNCTMVSETHKAHGLAIRCPGKVDIQLAAENAVGHREWLDALNDGISVANAANASSVLGADSVDDSAIRTVQFKVADVAHRNYAVWSLWNARIGAWQRHFESTVVRAPDVYQCHQMVDKYNEQGKEQNRTLVLSSQHLYNVDMDDTLFEIKSVKWCLPIQHLSYVTFDTVDDCSFGLEIDKCALTKVANSSSNPLDKKQFPAVKHCTYLFRTESEFERRVFVADLSRVFQEVTKTNLTIKFSSIASSESSKKQSQAAGKAASAALSRRTFLADMKRSSVLLFKAPLEEFAALNNTVAALNNSPSHNNNSTSNVSASSSPSSSSSSAAAVVSGGVGNGSGNNVDNSNSPSASSSSSAAAAAAMTTASSPSQPLERVRSMMERKLDDFVGVRILRNGWMEKKGGQTRHNWKKRWVVIFNKHTPRTVEASMTYHDKEGTPALGTVDLYAYDAKAAEDPKKKRQHLIEVSLKDGDKNARVYWFQAASEMEVAGWLSAIESAVKAPERSQKSPAPTTAVG